MSFLNLLNKKVIVARLSAVSGDKTSYTTVTAEYVNIQRMSDEKAVMVGGAIGQTFRLYANENADIEKGDQLKDTDTGYEYKVVGIVKPAELGNFIHKEAVVNLVRG